MPVTAAGGSPSFSLEQFDLVKTVGTGAFSRVYLSLHRATAAHYALKVVPIAAAVESGQAEHLVRERQILLKVRHPFIVPLSSCWRDRANLYFLFPFLPGGELFTFMRLADRLPASHVLFYSAEIVSALEYLHSLRIAYRDLKPENLLLDRAGHLLLTDLGFAVECAAGPGRETLCGTPEYLAPEVVRGTGHGTAVDWWALGVLMYEMLVGRPPFSGSDLLELYDQIVSGRVEWPADLAGEQQLQAARDLVERLLDPDTNTRLGGGGAAEVRGHKFFAGLDWTGVAARQLVPPIVPHLQSDTDTRYFNFYQENDIDIRQLATAEDCKIFQDF